MMSLLLLPKTMIPAGPYRSLLPLRLIVARCEVRYTGRLTAVLPEALRLLMLKSDGSVMVHADTGGFKPQNWMTPPTVIEEEPGRIVVRKHAGASEDRLEIIVAEVISDVSHDMGEAAALEKEGVERELQELLADAPPLRGGLSARATRVAHRHRAGRSDVPRLRRRLGRGGDQARGHARQRRAAHPLPGAHRRRPVFRRAVPRGAGRAESSPRPGRWRSRGGSCCAEVDPAVLRGEREPGSDAVRGLGRTRAASELDHRDHERGDAADDDHHLHVDPEARHILRL